MLSYQLQNLFSLPSSKFLKQRLHHFLIMSRLKRRENKEWGCNNISINNNNNNTVNNSIDTVNSSKNLSKWKGAFQKLKLKGFKWLNRKLSFSFSSSDLSLFNSNLLSFIFSVVFFLSQVFAQKLKWNGSLPQFPGQCLKSKQMKWIEQIEQPETSFVFTTRLPDTCPSNGQNIIEKLSYDYSEASMV